MQVPCPAPRDRVGQGICLCAVLMCYDVWPRAHFTTFTPLGAFTVDFTVPSALRSWRMLICP